MRGDTAAENEETEQEENPPSLERRPSLVNLQSTLKKVSQSPFHGQYKNLDSSGSDGNQFQNKQNGVGEDLSRRNPFYTYYMETRSEDVGRKTPSDAPGPVFTPPPEFQTSTLDGQTENQAASNGSDLSAPQRDVLQPLLSNLEMATQNERAGSRSVSLNSPDFFKLASAGAESSSIQFKDGRVRSSNPFDAPPRTFANPFTSPPGEDGLFLSPHPVGANPFHEAVSEAAIKQDPPIVGDLFSTPFLTAEDTFSPSCAHTPEPFPRTVTRDLLQDFSGSEEPSSSSPSSRNNPFTAVPNGTPDIFKPRPEELLSSPTPALSSPAESSDAAKPPKVVLATPKGSKHDILQATPFVQARSLSVSSDQSSPEMARTSTFKRQSNPLPRRRQARKATPLSAEKPPMPPRPVKPTEPEKLVETEPGVSGAFPTPALRSLPKPVIPRKTTTPVPKKVDPENYVIFQDILFTGQEKCVEDWPDDSPQLNPDFKPSGALRLRRESVKDKAEVEGDGGDQELDGCDSTKKREKRFRMSLLSRRGSKEKFSDEAKEEKSSTLPASFRSSKGSLPELQGPPGENDDGEQSGMEYRKKHLKTRVSQLLRRASTTSSVPDGKRMNGLEKDGDAKTGLSKADSFRRWSEGTVLDESTEEEEGREAEHQQRRRKKLQVKFVPQRGFAISLEKTEAKGAHGYTPSQGSKVTGAHSTVSPLFRSQGDEFEDVEQLKAELHSTNRARGSPTNRRGSQEDMLDEGMSGKKSTFPAEDLDDEEHSRMEDCRPKTSKVKSLLPPSRKQKVGGDQSDPVFSPRTPQHTSSESFAAVGATPSESSSMTPGGRLAGELEEPESHKAKKPVIKIPKKLKAKIKNLHRHDPPGATSSDYLSEAAKAEWMAAQMDEHAAAGLEDEEEDGDTDSLMEWWYTVEQWDELPSDEEDGADESKSFTVLAEKVQRGLRVFNKVFTERAEVLWQYVIALHAIADNISEFHQKAKIAGITGGTTTAVGGVTAVAGLVLAPFTFGASLVMTAVGVGVATAGGITSASAAISDNINNMHDRKKVETILQAYETQLLDISKILHFVDQGMYKLRGHPFLRSGTQHYSEYWEIRQAVQMISLVDTPVIRAVETTDSAIASVQGLFKGMDKYFLKDSRELKKGCKKEVVGQIKQVANSLNDAIVTLNAIREELHEATGSI